MIAEEFTRLMNAHGPLLILYARQCCRAPEDVVQGAFFKLVALRQARGYSLTLQGHAAQGD